MASENMYCPIAERYRDSHVLLLIYFEWCEMWNKRNAWISIHTDYSNYSVYNIYIYLNTYACPLKSIGIISSSEKLLLACKSHESFSRIFRYTESYRVLFVYLWIKFIIVYRLPDNLFTLFKNYPFFSVQWLCIYDSSALVIDKVWKDSHCFNNDWYDKCELTKPIIYLRSQSIMNWLFLFIVFYSIFSSAYKLLMTMRHIRK